MGRTVGFYQNFNLDLQRLSKALRCVEQQGAMGYEELAECMGVNRPVAEGYSGWLRHAGLARAAKQPGTPIAYSLTPFGKLAAEYDPNLDDLGTQWAIHYFLATEHTERSEAWYVLINEFLSIGRAFTGAQFASYFAGVAGQGITNRSSLTKDPQTALASYTRTQALSRIGIISKDGEVYKANPAKLPNALVQAFILLDWWQRHHPNVNMLRLSALYDESGSPGRIWLAERARMEQLVRELRGLGYLGFAATQHEQVTRLYSDPPESILERYYTHL